MYNGVRVNGDRERKSQERGPQRAHTATWSVRKGKHTSRSQKHISNPKKKKKRIFTLFPKYPRLVYIAVFFLKKNFTLFINTFIQKL